MDSIDKDEAERQKREAEQAAAAASARASQAESEAARLRAIVEGIIGLPTQAADIMAVLQTARVRVETDAYQASTVLADLKAAQDKAAAILNECRGHEATCREVATEADAMAVRSKVAADDIKNALVAAQGDSTDVHNSRMKAEEATNVIVGLRVKAERDAGRERKKSWLGIILAVLALVVAVGAVVAFYHFSHTHPDSKQQQPAAAAPAQPGQAPAPAAQPPTPSPPTLMSSVMPADKGEFVKGCQEDGQRYGWGQAECEADFLRLIR